VGERRRGSAVVEEAGVVLAAGGVGAVGAAAPKPLFVPGGAQKPADGGVADRAAAGVVGGRVALVQVGFAEVQGVLGQLGFEIFKSKREHPEDARERGASRRVPAVLLFFVVGGGVQSEGENERKREE